MQINKFQSKRGKKVVSGPSLWVEDNDDNAGKKQSELNEKTRPARRYFFYNIITNYAALPLWLAGDLKAFL